jgi:hypothetical protein
MKRVDRARSTGDWPADKGGLVESRSEKVRHGGVADPAGIALTSDHLLLAAGAVVCADAAVVAGTITVWQTGTCTDTGRVCVVMTVTGT